MNPSFLAQLDSEIEKVSAQLDALKAARMALGVASGATASTPAPARQIAPKAKGRAPKGALEAAMIKLLKAHPGLTNGEIRSRLQKDGYAWSLSGLHVGKRLSALVTAKELAVKLDGNKRRYSVTK